MATKLASRVLVTEEHVEKIHTKFAAGVPPRRIADHLRLSQKTVRRVLSGEDLVGKLSEPRTKKGKEFCPGCNQWIAVGKSCRRCDRDRDLGSRVRNRSRAVRIAAALLEQDAADIVESAKQREHQANELPEAFKFPKGITWGDNVEPIRPSDPDLVDVLGMLVNCDEPLEQDKYDDRWNVTTENATEGGEPCVG